MRARKVDNNHGAIRDALRKCGYVVFDCSRLGNGWPDLAVKLPGAIMLLEVKQPGEKLTPAEVEFFTDWQGPFVQVVHSVEEALFILSSAPA